MKKFYVTTPIYYVNGKPHIGHAYTTFAADILSRYHRMRGYDSFFLAGTDENAQKNVESAEEKKQSTEEYVNEMSALWQETWDNLSIINNDFIRTTEERHKAAVKEFFERVYKTGDIYKGTYEGFYCEGCEAFIKESDLVDGKCPDHKKKPKKIKEENYFFKLSKYRDELLGYIDKNPDFIQPKSRRNEIISYIKNYMEDISISRESMEWGIPVPSDEEHVLYVWFDALINYLTGVGFGKDNKQFKKYWPADVQLVGKDIIKFHCALWPAMLISAGLPLPKKVFAHGFFTINGEKISKSLGNAIDPVDLVNKYGIDAVRYYLFREIPFGEDGDFADYRLNVRYETDLANGLGNLTARILSMAEKYFKGKVPAEVPGRVEHFWKKYEKEFENFEFNEALATAWDLIRECDLLIDREQPWVLAKQDPEKLPGIIYTLLETLRHIAWMVYPFMPAAAEKILSQLGVEELEKIEDFKQIKKWGGMIEGTKVKKGDILFPRLEK